MKDSGMKLQNNLKESNFFIYKGRKYPFNIVLFNCFSQYFPTHQIQLQPSSTIKLIDEEKNKINLSESSIIDFIKFCQNQIININKENVIALHQLANIYIVPTLITATKEFINSHENDFAIEFIKMKQSTEDSSLYEEMISNNFINYIDNDELLSLPLSVVHRIVSRYAKKNSTEIRETTEKEKVTDFCFRCLEKFGRKASVLFEFADFGSTSGAKIKRLLTEYSDRFDFHFINDNHLKTLYELESKIFEREENWKQESSTMRLELERLRNKEDEIERIESAMRQELIEKLEHQETIIKNKEKEIEKIRNDFSTQQKLFKNQLENLSQQFSEKEEKRDHEIEQMKIQIQSDISSHFRIFRDQIQELNAKLAEKTAVIEQLESQIVDMKIARVRCQFSGESDPRGIISYLNNSVNLSAGGIHSPDCPLSNIKNYNTKYFYNHHNGYSPKSESDSFIKFDFGPSKKIDLHSYFIQTSSGVPLRIHPKSWRIEGSNDNSSWINLDKRVNDANLNGDTKHHHFICQENRQLNDHGRFRYIRFVQEDSWYSGSPYWVWISYFELYGDIICKE